MDGNCSDNDYKFWGSGQAVTYPIFVHTVILKVSVTGVVLLLCVIGSEILQQTNGKFMIDSILNMKDF